MNERFGGAQKKCTRHQHGITGLIWIRARRAENLVSAMDGNFLRRNQKAVFSLFIAVPMLLAVLVFVVLKQMYGSQQQRMTLVRHSYDVREQLFQLRNDLIQSEMGQNIFLLTSIPPYLQPFLFAESDAFVRLSYLSLLLAGRPAQLTRLNRLRPLIEKTLTENRGAVSSKESSNKKALQTVHEAQGPILPEQIAALIREMEANEDRRLSLLQKISQSDVDARAAVSGVLLFVTATIGVGAGVLLLRIRKLQNIITICAWTQRVNFNGKWMRMEEFLWNRFRVKVSHGISEEAFDGVVGMIGKNITVSDRRAERLNNPKAQPDAKSGN
jgi:CHASE3 domain sensor protein